MSRVLILTASYGSGHNAAARALATTFHHLGATVRVVDHFRELVHPAFERATRGIYYAMLRRAPALWGLAYGLGDRVAADSPLGLGVTRIGAGNLRRLLGREAFDVVVTVHATPSAAMSFLARTGEPVPPHTTVVTDFVAHGQWIAPGIDRYCVAAEEVKHEFIARGIEASRIQVTGVPLRPEFTRSHDPSAARRALGLGEHAPVVLVMAGSYGSLGRLPDVAHALARFKRPVQGVIVTGHDAGVARAIGRDALSPSIRTLAYVPNVRELMAAADLLVTKAGGMTLAEALAAELPLVLYGSLPGQERQNERFASRTGVALVARSRRELTHLLERAFDEPDLLDDLRRRMRAVRRPDATRHIVDAILDRAPA